MELDVYAILKSSPVLVLFLILGTGILVGTLTIAKVTVGSVSGVLLAGLLFGHLGLDVPTVSHDIGFLLFIYCIGAQAGPQFLRVFREDGSRYAWLSLVTAATGMLLAVEIGAYFEFEPGVAAGVLAGALTSTPTLVAAQDAMTNMGSLPGDFPVSEALENISAAYAITYVFGIAGLIAFLTLMPRLLRLDVVAEAQALSDKRGFGINPGVTQVGAPTETPKICAYRIDRPVSEEIYSDHDALPGEIQKVKRGDEVFTPDWDTRLQQGDVISLIGLQSAHQFVRDRLGPEVIDHDVLDRSVESRNVLVTRADVAGKTLAEMPFGGGQSVWLTELTRSGVPMPRRADLELHIGDVLLLTGPRSTLDEVADAIGEAESELHQTDLVALAFGIALGVFFGMVGIKIGETYVGLGSAGGVMLVGLLFGLINSYRPSFGRLPEGARYVLTELGLLLFMAGVAVSAGREIVEMLTEAGPKLALVGMVITLVPVSLSFLLGRYVFKMNAALLLGAMSGAMTSTGALQQISAQARSSVPMLGYVGTYAFANVLLTIAGGVVARF